MELADLGNVGRLRRESSSQAQGLGKSIVLVRSGGCIQVRAAFVAKSLSEQPSQRHGEIFDVARPGRQRHAHDLGQGRLAHRTHEGCCRRVIGGTWRQRRDTRLVGALPPGRGRFSGSKCVVDLARTAHGRVA